MLDNMDNQSVQFRDWVREKAPKKIPQKVLDFSISQFQCLARIGKGDVAACIQEAGVLFDELREEVSISSAKPRLPDLPGQPETRIATELLLDRLEASVKEVRVQIFGRAEVPFRTYSQAVGWIEKEELAGGERNAKSAESRLLGLVDELRMLLDRMSDVMDRPVSATLHTPARSYFKAGSGVLLIKVRRNSRLLPLKAFAQSASSEGFLEHELVAYALAGIRPTIHRITVGTEMVFGLRPPKITIEIRAQNPCWDYLRAAYRLILREIRRERHKHLDDVDQRIIAAILKLGKVPGKGTQAFWKKVANRTRMTADAARMRFRRLPQEISSELLQSSDSHRSAESPPPAFQPGKPRSSRRSARRPRASDRRRGGRSAAS